MNNFKIISLGRELDTYNDTSISFTYQIGDIEDITSKKSSFSKTIVLPGTPTNNEYFKHLFDINIDISNTSYNPKKSSQAKALIGDELIFEGDLQLINIIKDHDIVEYEVVLTGIFKNIIVSLGDYYLNQLNFDEYDHYRNNVSIQQSRDNIILVNLQQTQVAPGEGYTYPLIINGQNPITAPNQIVRINSFDLNPAVYVKTLIDKIFQFAGYTYTSTFINSDYFRSLITPTESSQLTSEDINNRTVRVSFESNNPFQYPQGTVLDIYNFGFSPSTLANRVAMSPMIPKSVDYVDNASNGCYYFPLKLEQGVFNEQQLQDPNNEWNTQCPYQYTCSQTGFYSVDLRNTFNMFYTNASLQEFKYNSGNIRYRALLRVIRTNGQVQTIAQTNPNGLLITPPIAGDSGVFNSNPYVIPSNGFIPPGFLHTSQNWVMNLNAPSVWLNEGDRVVVNFQLLHSNNVNWPASVLIGAIASRVTDGQLNRLEIKPSVSVNYNINELIKISKMLPNMKMKDYFLNIVKMFNLMIVENPNKENDLIIEPRDDFFKTKQKIKDWTYLLDYDNEIKITPMSELDVKSYIFSYKKDNDFYNKSYEQETGRIYGDYRIDFINDFSTKEKKLQLDFSPTPITDNLLNTYVAPYLCDLDTNNSLKPLKTQPRVLFSKKMSGKPGKFYIVANSPNDLGIQYNAFMYCGMYDDPYNPKFSLEWSNSNVLYYDTNFCCPNNNLINQFYLSTINDLTDVNAKIMEAYFYLTPSEISDFDFRDIILIDNTYWRVNKIVDYNPNATDTLTKVILYKLNNLDLTFGNNKEIADSPGIDCPTDVVAVKGKKGSGYIYISESGQPLTEDCCKFYGGTYVNGVCKAGNGGGGVIAEPLPGPLPTKNSLIPFEQTKSGSIHNERPFELMKNLNIINSDTVIVKGQNNYVDVGVTNSVVIGNNNNITSDVKNSLVIGDNISSVESNSLIVGDILINSDGISNFKGYIIDSGKDEVLNYGKTNLIDIIDGTKDSVRNYGGDSKARPIIDGDK